jgi:hypothetical protein
LKDWFETFDGPFWLVKNLPSSFFHSLLLFLTSCLLYTRAYIMNSVSYTMSENINIT